MKAFYKLGKGHVSLYGHCVVRVVHNLHTDENWFWTHDAKPEHPVSDLWVEESVMHVLKKNQIRRRVRDPLFADIQGEF